jgi:hypothetical protein
MNGETAVAAAPGVQLPAVKGQSLLHSHEPMTGRRQGRRPRNGSMTGIGDFQLEAISGKDDPHLGAGRPRVLYRVGQRLLHHPVRNQVQACGQRPGVAFHPHVNGQSRGTRPLS